MVPVLIVFLILVLGVTAAVALKPHLNLSLDGAILGLAGLCADDGLRTEDIAAAVHDDSASTLRTLRQLAQSGHVEAIPGSGSSRWRLTPAYRSLVESPELLQRRR